mgnify:CR=1 FL=1
MKYYKVMVTTPSAKILWDLMEREANVDKIMDLLNREIDLDLWKKNYLELYRRWIEHDDGTIYDVKNAINMDMINALIKFNLNNKGTLIYLWFDTDRDKDPNYKWVKCPLTGSKLIDLKMKVHKNNSKISPQAPLIFPDVTD